MVDTGPLNGNRLLYSEPERPHSNRRYAKDSYRLRSMSSQGWSDILQPDAASSCVVTFCLCLSLHRHANVLVVPLFFRPSGAGTYTSRHITSPCREVPLAAYNMIVCSKVGPWRSPHSVVVITLLMTGGRLNISMPTCGPKLSFSSLYDVGTGRCSDAFDTSSTSPNNLS